MQNIVLCLFIVVKSAHSLVPHECVGGLANGGICCPVRPGTTWPCGGAGRGACSRIVPARERPMGDPYNEDERLQWPVNLFQYMCRCRANFFGPSCNECWYGWEGENCDQRKLVQRRNIESLNPSELYIFRRVLYRSMTFPSDFIILVETHNFNGRQNLRNRLLRASIQHVISFIHRFTSRGTLLHSKAICDETDPLNFNHSSCAFITWHRYFMLFWERQLAKMALTLYGIRDFTLPYWDWFDQNTCNICTNDKIGAVGHIFDRANSSQPLRLSRWSDFYSFQEFCPEPSEESNCVGCHINSHYKVITREWISSDFPTTGDLDYMMAMRRFHSPIQLPSQEGCISFDTALEGFCARPNHPSPNLSFMHNRLHNMVKGSFCCSSTSVSDPIFILHHVQIDRIFEAWLRNNPGTPANMDSQSCMPGHCYSCNMVGFLPPVRNSQMYTTSNNLGYIYDNFNFGKHGRTF